MKNVEKDVVLDEIMKELIISKEDFKDYFNERRIITKQEYREYLEARTEVLKNSRLFPDSVLNNLK